MFLPVLIQNLRNIFWSRSKLDVPIVIQNSGNLWTLTEREHKRLHTQLKEHEHVMTSPNINSPINTSYPAFPSDPYAWLQNPEEDSIKTLFDNINMFVRFCVSSAGIDRELAKTKVIELVNRGLTLDEAKFAILSKYIFEDTLQRLPYQEIKNA